MATTDRRYDLIFLDVCTAGRLPPHLFTREAFALTRERLAPDGVLAVQLIAGDGRFAASVARTAREVFGDCLLLAPPVDLAPVGPRWLFAGNAPPESEMRIDGAPWRVVVPDAPGEVLTDDRFPVERDWAEIAAVWRRRYHL